MAKTREIRKRIMSVRNIHKITRTMEQVAQSKGMKLTGRFDGRKGVPRGPRAAPARRPSAPPWAASQAPGARARTRWARAAAEVKRVLLFCVTSSRGLCGGYNARVIQATQARMEELAGEGKEAAPGGHGQEGPGVLPLPQPARGHLRAGRRTRTSLPQAGRGRATRSSARYVAREFDAVEWSPPAYETQGPCRKSAAAGSCRSSSAGRRRPPRRARRRSAGPAARRAAVPRGAGPRRGPRGAPPARSSKVELFCAVLEAMLCEQAQRSIAMRSASDNADSMTKRLTRTYNRARQAQITNEMIEIISGSEGGRT